MTDAQFNAAELARFNANLQKYLAVSSRTHAEIISRKGNDVRIAMWRAFRSKRWGGRRKAKGIAFKEAEARGWRVRVRPDIKVNRVLDPMVSSTGRRLSLAARKVHAELRLRQQGIGVLGAAFLLKRWNASRTKLRMNTTGYKGRRMLADFSFDSNPISDSAVYVATGYREGLDVVSGRYRIAATALSNVSNDIEKYLKRKEEESMRKAFGGN